MRTPERTRRSLSQGDDTPRPSGLGIFQGASPSPTHDAIFHNSADHGHAAKRLGFLGEKLLSSANSGSSTSTVRGTTNPIHTSRSHSRAESANLLSRDVAPSPTPGMAASSAHHAKAHASPSKVSMTANCIGVVVSAAVRLAAQNNPEPLFSISLPEGSHLHDHNQPVAAHLRLSIYRREASLHAFPPPIAAALSCRLPAYVHRPYRIFDSSWSRAKCIASGISHTCLS